MGFFLIGFRFHIDSHFLRFDAFAFAYCQPSLRLLWLSAVDCFTLLHSSMRLPRYDASLISSLIS